MHGRLAESFCFCVALPQLESIETSVFCKPVLFVAAFHCHAVVVIIVVVVVAGCHCHAVAHCH